MKNYNIYPYKSDLIFNKNDLKNIDKNIDINILNNIDKDYIIKTILFNKLDNQNNLKHLLTNQLIDILGKMNISKKDHIFVVGLGNDNHTADSIGPKTLKYIKVNSFLENIGIKIINNKISALEPGVLGETGILTEKIIYSVSKEIKPNLIILVDSFVSDDINYLNKAIQITNKGLNPGSGIKGINSVINKDILGVPILVIGVVTAVEIKFSNDKNINFIPYLLCTKDIDEFINIISKIIGESINEAINNL